MAAAGPRIACFACAEQNLRSTVQHFDMTNLRRATELPTIVCAWCKQVIRRGEAKVSHGICSPCRQKWFGKTGHGGAAVAAPIRKTA